MRSRQPPNTSTTSNTNTNNTTTTLIHSTNTTANTATKTATTRSEQPSHLEATSTSTSTLTSTPTRETSLLQRVPRGTVPGYPVPSTDPHLQLEPQHRVDRAAELRKVFAAFDYDGSGVVEAKELQVLGERAQVLGQKVRVWTAEKNGALVKKLDANGDGTMDESEFVAHFLSGYTFESDGVFLDTMRDFMRCVQQNGGRTKKLSQKLSQYMNPIQESKSNLIPIPNPNPNRNPNPPLP